MKKILSGVLVAVMAIMGALGFGTDKVFAAECPEGCVETAILNDGNSCVCDNDGDSIKGLLWFALEILSAGVFVLGAIGIIVMSIQYVTAGGDEGKTRKAKRRLLEIVIGLAVYFAAFGILGWLNVKPDFSGSGGGSGGGSVVEMME